ncbi:uncharacterized protein E5676_scaffold298G001010 [Cucumis melo var. makuwa]|uniref:Uncharacterized protein n=1 Tax=Cucumis melo var. makuwa TaxID=1194695 RepID=A0A5D3BVT6_CUCMM|nr:uncharacterized protein E6C27_scaffold230G00270 [Cucumis melo var. makuwa]TYK03274.1 uncharacterized protein E5676_scaffold298G001010 [Cucumis melo var. makuwa]
MNGEAQQLHNLSTDHPQQTIGAQIFSLHRSFLLPPADKMDYVLPNNRIRNLKDGSQHRDLRSKIFQFLTGVGKFAVDSTIFSSLKAVSGKNQVHKIRQGGLKDTPHSSSLNERKPEEVKLVMDKMQAEMEEKEGNQNKMKQRQHHCTSAEIVDDDSEPLKKKPGESDKGSANVIQNKKRIFIRSRL